MAVKKEAKAPSKQDDSKTFAFLATFLSIIGFVIALVTKKDDKYVMFYAKQSLILFIANIIVYAVGAIIPIIGWFIIMPIGGLVIFVLWIISWLNALSGEEKELPVIGKFAEKFNF